MHVILKGTTRKRVAWQANGLVEKIILQKAYSYGVLRDKNPEMVAGEKKKFVMRPPQVFLFLFSIPSDLIWYQKEFYTTVQLNSSKWNARIVHQRKQEIRGFLYNFLL